MNLDVDVDLEQTDYDRPVWMAWATTTVDGRRYTGFSGAKGSPLASIASALEWLERIILEGWPGL